MNVQLLHDVGAALYGPRWQSELAAALGVSVRTVQRWASGKNAVPSWLSVKLAESVSGKLQVLEKLSAKLCRLLETQPD